MESLGVVLIRIATASLLTIFAWQLTDSASRRLAARLRLKGYRKVALRASSTFCRLLFVLLLAKFLLRDSTPASYNHSVLTSVALSLFFSAWQHGREFKAVASRNTAGLRP